MRRFLLMSAICCLLAGLAWGVLTELPRLRLSPEARQQVYPDRLYDVSLRGVVDSICVLKQRREMFVFRGDSLLKVYRVALGDTPVGHKRFEGDERTPEGLYRIYGRNPYSSCHKNLGISYPNDRDRRYAANAGRSPGGDIKIHGLPNGQGYLGKAHLASDWTNGCVGITDEEVDELYRYVKLGSPILILP